MPIGAGISGQWGIADEIYTNEVQTLTGTPSGTFTLTYDGATTTALATNASAAAIQAALEALPNIGTGNVVGSGGPLPTAVTLTFSGPPVAGRNIPQLIVQTGITGLTAATSTGGTGYGDYVAPTQFNEIISAKPVLVMDRIKSSSIRAGNTIQRIDRKIPNKKGATHDVSLEVPTKSFSKIAKGIFGQAPTITTPLNGVLTRKHHHAFSDTRNQSFTVQVGIPTVLGDASNVKAITSVGCKVDKASFKCPLDGFLICDVSYNAKDETDTQTLAAASFASSFDLYHYLDCVVQIAGANVDVTNFELNVDNKLATNRRFLSGTPLQKQQILNAMRDISGKLTLEFDSLVHYDRWKSTTLSGALVPITVTFTGPVIEAVTGGYNHQLVFTMPQCDVVGTTPTLDNPDLVQFDIPFEANWDGTTDALTLDIFTTDTTA